ncbi:MULTISPECIES: hypothetical protein [Thiorhodovibrio]|uniref:hypothetical protein n=1 Tax=Thiorhodovibrio TaxID=61593 RepID=UPI0019139F8F|nr:MULTISPECIES: hypothetical protein [Thiorhodovibrio]MBK5969479.1 hypothetical protein [Thiorhodovibrio winogradskyi]WPL14985.1 hypothetical protein Thiosp_04845 [Thiorhodovibrio litoralis]
MQPAERIELTFKTTLGELSGQEAIYRPLIDALAEGPRTLDELQQALPALNIPSLVEALSLLAHSGAVGMAQLAPVTEPAQRFNRVVADLVTRGAPYNTAAAPGLGSGLSLADIDWMALDALHQGATDLPALVAGVTTRLAALNRGLLKDGNRVPVGAEQDAELSNRLQPFLESTLPRLRALGAVA